MKDRLIGMKGTLGFFWPASHFFRRRLRTLELQVAKERVMKIQGMNGSAKVVVGPTMVRHADAVERSRTNQANAMHVPKRQVS